MYYLLAHPKYGFNNDKVMLGVELLKLPPFFEDLSWEERRKFSTIKISTI